LQFLLSGFTLAQIKKTVEIINKKVTDIFDTLSFATSIGIQKHVVRIEIPGFDLPNQFPGFTTSLLFLDGFHKVIFNDLK
jgi:hypothetical protein